MSKIFNSIEVSQEVSDSVDETFKIIELIQKERIRLDDLNLDSIQYSEILEIIINVAKNHKNEN